jgi:hypothetical protein
MSDENVLTKELAEQFLANEDVDSRDFTEQSDAAAESLSKHRGDLAVWGLTTLSDAAAKSLSKHQGTLLLSGLTHLSGAAAQNWSIP